MMISQAASLPMIIDWLRLHLSPLRSPAWAVITGFSESLLSINHLQKILQVYFTSPEFNPDII
jgi:hypothetical protein